MCQFAPRCAAGELCVACKPGDGSGSESFLFSPCQLLDCDQELYKNFPLVISERWQQEVAETVFEAVNADTDKVELRKRAKNKQLGHEEGTPSARLGSAAPRTRLPLSMGRVGH